MSRKKKLKEVEKLISLGKKKGFLTFDEVNDILPSDIVSSEQIDDMMMMFGEMDIEVVDDAQRIKIQKQQSVEVEGEEEEDELDSSALGKTNDPVRMYLREMGSVSLLTRDGEVEIAKRIERGKREVTRAILCSPVALKEIVMIGEKLEKGRLLLKEITRDLEEEDNDTDEELQFVIASNPQNVWVADYCHVYHLKDGIYQIFRPLIEYYDSLKISGISFSEEKELIGIIHGSGFRWIVLFSDNIRNSLRPDG